MFQKHNFIQLTNHLKSSCQLVELPEESALYQDVITVSNYLENPNFQIAVFAPFNYGKSTLLNAMLGNRTLPIDLIPTTGAAITVKYGTTLRTRILLTDGTEIYRDGTKILEKFAILDNNRQMRKDIKSVEVFCPHSFLERNVELIDLPGTNDRETQDNLVQNQLLSADLVIQLLDARKLMTLGERENLRDWLLAREIKSVIFVVNFLNLLEPEEQKQVYHRLLFVAESFRANLPPGFSNLYRVDALPALRGRLKNDLELVNRSGLSNFETALQHIVGILQQNYGDVCLPRLEVIANKIQLLLVDKITNITQEIKTYDDKEKTKVEIKQKAKSLISNGFQDSIRELRSWLELSNLLTKYQGDLAVALAENNFTSWQIGTFKKDLNKLQLSVMKWLYQSYEFFQAERPEDLKLPFPNIPELNLPPKPNININNNNELLETGSIAVGTGVGWLLGGPVGAAVVGSISYLLNKNVRNNGDTSQNTYHQEVAKICITTAEKCLSQFSIQCLSIVDECEYKNQKVIDFQPEQEPQEIKNKRTYLSDLQNALYQLSQELNKFNIKTPYPPQIEINHTVNNQSVNNQTSSYPTEREQETSNQKVTTPKVKSLNTAELEAKFLNWEIDEEIAAIKANINSVDKEQVSQAEKDRVNNAYQILGLQPSASFSDVKETYKKLVKKWHPDLFINQPLMYKQAQEKIRLLNAAYNILEAYYQ
ncbi:MAG: dynamin family protein [Nostocales cyanobacterium]|nr:MAG: dynamin family protein [Nostocales cyanobacterium]